MANLMDDPTATLEDGTTGRWNVVGGGISTTDYGLSNSTDQAHTGTHSLELLFTTGDAAQYSLQTSFSPADLYPMVDGVYYDFEGWIFAPIGSTVSETMIEFNLFDASYDFLMGFVYGSEVWEVEGEWAKFSGSATMPADSAWGAFVVAGGVNPFFGAEPNRFALDEKRYFDDFVIQEHVTLPPPDPDPYGWGFGVRMSKVPIG